MKKVVLYIAISLDGYIADKNGSVDFLDDFQDSDEGDYGYQDFVDTIDTCIMGSNTYSAILGFGYPWPYIDQDTYVATSNPNFVIDSPQTSVFSQDIKESVQQLKAKGTGKDIWLVGGGKLVQYFLNAGLLDKMIITITPKILGKGIPLFPEQLVPSNWDLTAHSIFASGVVVLTYEKRTL